jgi:hypothetical protein
VRGEPALLKAARRDLLSGARNNRFLLHCGKVGR